MPKLLFPILALLAISPLAQAEVRLASPFTSHAVLQRDASLPIWGWADPAEEVTVTFAGQTKTATASPEGKWKVELSPLPASAEPRTLTVKGTNTITLDDILVGEVWIASGQSNMDFAMSKSVASWAGVENEQTEIAAANYPQVRMFLAEPIRSHEVKPTVPGKWLVCTSEHVPAFSAIGYYFARDLNQELKVPVGILRLTFGASCAPAWIRREAIEAVPELKAELAKYDEKVAAWTPPTEEDLAKWQTAADAAKAAGKRVPGRPKPHPSQDQHNPTVMYNGVIAPVVPYAARGVIWYQGESITDPKALFPKWNETLIADWRTLWGNDLPFYFCQLAAHGKNSNSPEVRAMQAEALKIPNTAMAVTIDIGDKSNVHPRNKKDVGARLARIALARDYGRKVEYVGPTLTSAKVERDAVRLTFTHADGLIAKGGALNNFELAGPDGKFIPAIATLEGTTVLLRAEGVTSPTAARYAWSNYPENPNLYNGAGLPAVPFKTEITP